MNTLNTVLLLIGLFILIPSMMYLSIYHMVNAIVLYQKNKSKISIGTNIVGVKEIKDNVPKSLLRLQTKLKENKVFANMGLTFGFLMIAIPILYIWFEYLKSFIPTLIK
ncbi:hypothetical protein QP586_11655 [Staphylococcus sp. UMB10092B]|nr:MULTISPECIES: hypothetical protein [Staphylococcus]EWI86053.1 hypothetical protein U667_02742 [Staphylococcus aureus T44811]EYK00129.1 hypothetical protein V606_02414 [Staphylococcus aureus M17027]MBM9733173.1 hypothetical protein [Staphylococcus aureus]MDK7753954.1 hypothetical protein [Staphylococcus sp. UMB10092B]MDW3868551.1 hypothetical protein [Staphylococcus saprophyticus]